MDHALSLLAWNLILSVPLALLVWCVCRMRLLRARPALCHGLWLLVLLKLVTPPLIPIPVLPALQEVTEKGEQTRQSDALRDDASSSAAMVAAPLDAAARPRTALTAVERVSEQAAARGGDADSLTNSRGIDAWHAALYGFLTVSGLVTLAIWVAAIRQLRRLQRLLRGAGDEMPDLSQLLRDVSWRFACPAQPALCIVDAAVVPLLWAKPGAPTVILSRELALTLSEEQLRHVLAHELAHYVRRDHWTNVFGFLVASLFWWHPVAWLARRELNEAAETCCDALVLERFYGSRKSYSQTLLAVVDFVQSGELLRPALALTFGESSSLRRRFQMLANGDVRSQISQWGWGLLAVGAVLLVLLPARAQEPKQAAPPAAAAPPRQESAKAARPATAAGTIAAESAAPAGKYYVAGSVFDEETKEPIAGASLSFFVGAELEPAKRLRKTVTDERGRFRVEMPLGKVQLWFPALKPGYWLAWKDSMTSLATSVEKPVATLDVAAKRGPVWPVQIAVQGDLPENVKFIVDVKDIADADVRAKLIAADPRATYMPTSGANTWLDRDGRGALTQCGSSGKLVVSVGADSHEIKTLATELLVDPTFDVTNVVSAGRLAGTNLALLTDNKGAKATIANAEVTVSEGRPLLTFHLERKPTIKQEFAGRVVDAAGKPIGGVRVGTAIGIVSGGSAESPAVANTDAEGRFRLEVPLNDSAHGCVLNFVFNKPGYASADSRRIPLPKKQVQTIDAGKFTLKPGHMLPIRVVDTHEQPLVGAVVEPVGSYAERRLAIRTDAEGRGILRDIPAGMLRVQITHADQGENQRVVVSPVEAENGETTLRLKAATAAPTPAAKAKPDKFEPIALGQAAPELELEAWTDGQARTLADYRGKVVVLDFWGTWCGGCVTCIPMLQTLADKYETQGVIFLSIHTPDGEPEQINKLKKLKGWKTECGIDRGTSISDGASSKLYGVNGYPNIIVIDAGGTIAFNSNIQPKDMEDFEKDMERLAVSLGIPVPLQKEGDEGDEKWMANMNKLLGAMLGREIDKALGTKAK